MIEEKKKMDEEKKNTIVGFIAVLVVIGIIAGGVFYFIHKKDANKSSEFGGISSTITEYPEMENGKKVGEYAVVNYNPQTTTDQQIVNYFNKKIKGNSNNYFVLNGGAKNTIQFPDSIDGSPLGIWKGSYDSQTNAINFNSITEKGTIQNNTIVWSPISS